MIKQFFSLTLVSFLLLGNLSFGLVSAQAALPDIDADAVMATPEQTDEVVFYYFEDRLCSVCAQQKEFMNNVLLERYDNLTINTYDISETDRFREFAAERGIEEYRVMSPSVFVGDDLLQFSSFGEREQQALIDAIEGTEQNQENVIRLPLINKEIKTDNWSLPLLAIVLGSLDGFNVCSLGALILILTIVLTFDSRKKVFFYGGAFIVTTVLVYGALVFLWGQLMNAFIGQLGVIRLFVGVASIAGSVWFFKEFWRFYKHGPTCETSESGIAKKASNRLSEAFSKPGRSSAALLGAIVLFAVAITLVELPCSIGIPIAFTGILVESGVSIGAYSLYVAMYLLFYMLIEMIIFTGAVLTKEIWFAGSKLITWATFTGAIILLSLGLYYLLAL